MTGEDNSPRNAPATPRHGLFISYRRDDARGASGRLYDWLRIAFGREKVFRDVASIGPGKWRQRIDQALADSIVCLPVIGPRWCDSHNGPRLAQDGDMVRHELLTALADQDLTLIPTLVEGAAVPPQNKLPAELHALLEWNAFPLSEQGWDDDIRRLLAAVTECSGQPVAGDVDTLLIRVREAEARMRQLEQEKHLQADQLHALTETITALTRQMAENPASQRADLARALADLARVTQRRPRRNSRKCWTNTVPPPRTPPTSPWAKRRIRHSQRCRRHLGRSGIPGWAGRRSNTNW
ncbi:MAG: toll/interleukin-1 receptor domain-containing protein [Propionivibrio sp.]|nr:toll/interleukin-1 receptor domain-containing protein [Propionivibrio sp.]